MMSAVGNPLADKTNSRRCRQMSIAETLLVLGTFGICTGVWVTLGVIFSHNRQAENMALQNARPKEKK